MTDEHFEAQFPVHAREEEIAKIFSYIKDGKSCQIIGIPGVSRSTTLGLIAYNKKVRKKHLETQEKSLHFVKADFSEIRHRPLFDAMKYLFLNLTESLRERGMKEENIAVGDKFREHLQFNDELVLFQGFKEAIDYMALEKKITTVFLFDRFEEYIPTVTSEFFTNLRILRNRAKYKFSIVFSINRPLEDLLDPSLLADYYEFIAGNTIYLNIADSAISDFRISYIEKIVGRDLSAEQKKSILASTGGHGKLTKLSVEAVLAYSAGLKDLNSFLLEQKTINRALEEIWLSLLPSEQTDLLEEKFDESENDYLGKVGLIRNNKINIPLFADYLKREHKNPVDTSGITYDNNTNTIHRGKIILSDQLTSSEFRLLRYLIQNPEKIVERDELISVVWKDVKTTAGITDQAVDQLIFRVRRKIEEDPNHPSHLLTVKGRGFKFAV